MPSSTGDNPDPDDYEWDFETRGSVGIWYLDNWQGYADEDLEAVSEHYRERASRDDITATVATFGEETTLGTETQEYMGQEWSENGAYVGVERIGFVSGGTTAMAVEANVEVEGTDLDSFRDLDEAVAWAQGGD